MIHPPKELSTLQRLTEHKLSPSTLEGAETTQTQARTSSGYFISSNMIPQLRPFGVPNSFFVLFCGHTRGAQGLFLTLHLGITPGGAQGTI